MKKFLEIMIVVALVAIGAVQASPIVTPITQADIDALVISEVDDIIWNAQFFPNSGNRQFSVGPGLDGTHRADTTTWNVSPDVNPFFTRIDGANNLASGVNSDVTNSAFEFIVKDSYNEIWVFIRADVDFPDPGDILEVSGLNFGSEPLPTLTVLGGEGFSGFKMRLQDFPSNIGEFNLSGTIEQQFGGVTAKDWNVNVVGVSAIPEPSSLILVFLGFAAVNLMAKFKK